MSAAKFEIVLETTRRGRAALAVATALAGIAARLDSVPIARVALWFAHRGARAVRVVPGK